MSPVINAKELSEVLNNNDLVLIDASAGPDAAANYAARHIEAAVFVDLNKDLAEIKEDAANGGRHPLPSVEKFSATLGTLGISPKSHVVVYDQKNGSNAAARLWWMLRAIGHKNVQVLSGGIAAAENAGIKISNAVPVINKTTAYPVDKWQLLQADMQTVEAYAGNKDHIVIDVRDAERYRGEKEPIDLVAGHIPGAVNIPFTGNLDSKDEFLSPQILKEKYQAVFDEFPQENIVVHCGSGVTACHTLLAMACAGFEIPAIYVGSWSEWSRNHKPIGKAGI